MALDPYSGSFISPSKSVLATQQNYRSVYDFTHQFLPDQERQLMKIYSDQSLTGFLDYFGMSQSFASDKTIWAEEGRRHTLYNDVSRVGDDFTKTDHVFRVGEVIEVQDPGTNTRDIGRISAVTTDTFTAVPYNAATWTVGAADLTVFVVGSEFAKGTGPMNGALTRDFTVYENKPIIAKDFFEVAGSDIPSISWFTDPTTGTEWWYLEDEIDNYRAFIDKLELQMLTAERASNGSPLEPGPGDENGTLSGTEGYWAALRDRGNNFSGIITDDSDWQSIIVRLDNQRGETMNALYTDREQSFAIDSWLASKNSDTAIGASYGLFENRKDMALELSFKGFSWQGYEFYKTDWKILIDPTVYGAETLAADYKIHGVMVPMGETYVQDRIARNPLMKVPYLTLMYREGGGQMRKLKSWMDGGAAPTPIGGDDVLRVHYLSERMLRTVGANRHFLIEGTA